MPISSSNSRAVLSRDQAPTRWTPAMLCEDEKTVKTVPMEEVAFRVLIVDRDSMTSDLLAHALASDGRFEAVAIPPSDLLRSVSAGEIDLVILGADLGPNCGSGFTLAESVHRLSPGTSIVMLLNFTTQEAVLSAFRCGARGVFSRQQPMHDFLDCVDHVRKGFIWAGKDETDSLLEALTSIPFPDLTLERDLPGLTARELEVVRCAAKGKTNRMIANELGLSEHTVKNYLFRAFAKMGVSNRVELLFYLTSRT